MNNWTETEKNLLIGSAAQGIDFLVLTLGRSRGSIYTMCSKIGVKIPRVLKYDRNGSELENKTWAWHNRIFPSLTKNGSCMEWNGSNSKGYGQIRIFVEGKQRIFSTHRIAWEVKNRQILPSETEGCHSCDNPRCNNPDHIFAGTHLENVKDMHGKGRARGMFVKGQLPHANISRGIQRGNALLSDDKVMNIRVIHSAGLMGQKLLARMFGVSAAITRRAILRRGWMHVPEATIEQRENILREYLKTHPATPKRTGRFINL